MPSSSYTRCRPDPVARRRDVALDAGLMAAILRARAESAFSDKAASRHPFRRDLRPQEPLPLHKIKKKHQHDDHKQRAEDMWHPEAARAPRARLVPSRGETSRWLLISSPKQDPGHEVGPRIAPNRHERSGQAWMPILRVHLKAHRSRRET